MTTTQTKEEPKPKAERTARKPKAKLEISAQVVYLNEPSEQALRMVAENLVRSANR